MSHPGVRGSDPPALPPPVLGRVDKEHAEPGPGRVSPGSVPIRGCRGGRY